MKRGIVLGGGGSRGAYQVGVWQALDELGIEYDIVTGTSIGALNGALMIQGDFDVAKKMWEETTYSNVIAGVTEGNLETIDGAAKVFKGFLSDIKSKGALDITPLEQLVRKYLSEDLVRNSPKEFGFVTVEFPTIKEIKLTKEGIPQGMMADYLLASAACFPIFKTKVIDKTKYVDGGYRNNLPIDMAIRLGAEEIIAVDLESMGFIPKVRRFDVPVRFIRSYWSLGLFLNFDASRLGRNMVLGYLDAMKSFEKLEGLAFAFHMGETDSNYEKYGADVLALIARFKKHEAKEKPNPLKHLVQGKIRKVIASGGKHGFYNAISLRRIAEIAGEVVDLPIAQVYYFDEYNKALISAFDHSDVASFELIQNILNATTTLAEKAQSISEIDLKLVVNFIYKAMDGMYKEDGKNHNLWMLAGIATSEFLAALYLYVIKNDKVLAGE